MVTLDELYQGKILYKSKIKSNRYAFDKGVLISKYLFSLNYNEHEVFYELYEKFEPVFSELFPSDEVKRRILYILNKAKNEGQPEYRMIAFNQSELDAINELEDMNEKLVLMTLLCVYKYVGGEFQVTSPELIKLTKIKTIVPNMNKIINNVLSYGYFNPYIKSVKEYESTRYLTYYKPNEKLILLAGRGGSILQIDDFRNLNIRLRQILGFENNYYFCERCGIIDTRKSDLRKYCTMCKKELNIENNKRWVKKTGWIHPNRKESNSSFYYRYDKKE